MVSISRLFLFLSPLLGSCSMSVRGTDCVGHIWRLNPWQAWTILGTPAAMGQTVSTDSPKSNVSLTTVDVVLIARTNGLSLFPHVLVPSPLDCDSLVLPFQVSTKTVCSYRNCLDGKERFRPQSCRGSTEVSFRHSHHCICVYPPCFMCSLPCSFNLFSIPDQGYVNL